MVHGHSSHHIKGVEVYKGKLIAFGCGDFLSDYEGIGSGHHGPFRDDLSFMYLADVDSQSGQLLQLRLVPMRLKHMQVRRAEGSDRDWLFKNMRRESQRFGNVELESDQSDFKLIFQKQQDSDAK